MSEPDLRRLAVPPVGVSRLAEDEVVCRKVGRVEGVVGYAGDRADVLMGVDVVDVAGTGGGEISAVVNRFIESGRVDGMVLIVSPPRLEMLTQPAPSCSLQRYSPRQVPLPRHGHTAPFPLHPPRFHVRALHTLPKELEGVYGLLCLLRTLDGRVTGWDPTAN